MKIAAVGENLLESLALRANLGPRPLLETQIAFNAARAIMAGAELGIFEAVAAGSHTAGSAAAACGTDPAATRQLLDCLVALGYLRHKRDRYLTTPVTRKWVLRASPVSVADKLVFQTTEWDWMAGLEEYVRSGNSIDLHKAAMSPRQWAQYQDAMRALSVAVAPAVARKLPMPPSPATMLDIGGSHGLFSVALCRRYSTLHSTILELPEAEPQAARLLGREDTGGRVRVRAGNALTDDLGTEVYDLILLSNVAHHFSADENNHLAVKAARALKPGGYYAIGEFVRREHPGSGGAVAATSDLYFSLTSTSGTWNRDEIQRWQTQAGLTPSRRRRYVVLPGYETIVARRPGTSQQQQGRPDDHGLRRETRP